MATGDHQFGVGEVVIFHEESLGVGSYGGVYRAKCNGLPCAAKIMHRVLFDHRDPRNVSYLRRFEEECRILSSIPHPNVVQYLGTYHEHECGLPVLLMEICDESLTRFLEQSPLPVSHHILVNIAHDVALGLAHLHRNRIIHRDLSSNNVLLTGQRAKITDFGMSKLVDKNHYTPMTMCPGSSCYMAPEALDEPPSYTDKLDVFSFGVLLVQIVTRKFPDPGHRFEHIDVSNYIGLRKVVPETQRRASHLCLIPDTNPLKTLAVHCLKDKEEERPTAHQCEHTLFEMKQAHDYTESLQQSQTGLEGEVDSLRRQIHDLKQDSYTKQKEFALREKKLQQMMQYKQRQFQYEMKDMETQLQQLSQQLRSQKLLTKTKTEEIVQTQRTLQEKERELTEKVVQLQQMLDEKDRTICHLQQASSAHVNEETTNRPPQKQSAIDVRSPEVATTAGSTYGNGVRPKFTLGPMKPKISVVPQENVKEVQLQDQKQKDEQIDDDIDERDMMNMLYRDACKWEDLGTQFGFDCHELEEIKMSQPQGGAKDWLRTLISKKKARTVPFGWRDVVKALRAIDCNKTAEMICRKYKIHQPLSTADVKEDIVVLKLKESSDSKLKGKFCALIMFAADTLEKKGEEYFQNFKTYVIAYFSLDDRILEATSYRRVFNLIGQEKKWDYKNYFPLLDLLSHFIDKESRERCRDYQEAVTGYHATERLTETMSSHDLTKVCQECNKKHQNLNFHEIHVKLHPHRVTEESLSYVRTLWESMSRYFSLPLLKTVFGHMPSVDAEADCLCATLPPRAHVELSAENAHSWKRFMEENNILEICFDNGRTYSQQ